MARLASIQNSTEGKPFSKTAKHIIIHEVRSQMWRFFGTGSSQRSNNVIKDAEAQRLYLVKRNVSREEGCIKKLTIHDCALKPARLYDAGPRHAAYPSSQTQTSWHIHTHPQVLCSESEERQAWRVLLARNTPKDRIVDSVDPT